MDRAQPWPMRGAACHISLCALQHVGDTGAPAEPLARSFAAPLAARGGRAVAEANQDESLKRTVTLCHAYKVAVSRLLVERKPGPDSSSAASGAVSSYQKSASRAGLRERRGVPRSRASWCGGQHEPSRKWLGKREW